jgi:hypothetical protein
MLAATIEGVLGFLLAASTLRDVFDTAVVPGPVRGSLKISRRLVFLALPLWRRYARGTGIGVNFAPAMLVATFVAWMVLLVLGFGMLAHALGEFFTPRLAGFGEALYVAGSALATIGLGNSAAYGPAAVVVVTAGLCGLAVMTMAVTYLLEVQGDIGARDTGVLKINTTAGDPPSGLAVLERYAALGCRDELADLLRNGRDWCARVLQSHGSHPSLIYFRTIGTGAGWPAALGAVLDVALIIQLVIDEPAGYAASVLAREEAERLARDIVTLLDLGRVPAETSSAQLQQLCERLTAAGYKLRANLDLKAFAKVRAEHAGCVEALAHHLGRPGAPLVADEGRAVQ